MIQVELLDEEQGLIPMYYPPTTVASFYERKTKSPDILSIRKNLLERFKSIITANPWLCGRLVRIKSDEKTTICILYHDNVVNTDGQILYFTNDALFEKKQWRSICNFIVPYLPKETGKCVDKDELLCKLLIFQNTTGTELALVFSLSHALGDAHTLYYLWKMLDTHEDVIPMIVNRNYNFAKYVERDTNLITEGPSPWKFITLLTRELGRGLSRWIMRKSDPRINIYKLNRETINRIKTKYSNGDEYVSTNDILTSWFFGENVCNIDRICMFVNLRERIPELSNNMAGSYSLANLFDITNANNPRTFRERWYKVLRKEYPKLTNVYPTLNISDNWTSLYHQVELVGYTHAFHVPVYSDTKAVAGIPFCPEGFIMMFSLDCENIGVMLGCYNDIPDEYFDDNELFLKKIL